MIWKPIHTKTIPGKTGQKKTSYWQQGASLSDTVIHSIRARQQEAVTYVKCHPSARGLTPYQCSLMTGATHHQRLLAKRQAVPGARPLGEQILFQSILPSSLCIAHCSEETIRTGGVSNVSHLLHEEIRPEVPVWCSVSLVIGPLPSGRFVVACIGMSYTTRH